MYSTSKRTVTIVFSILFVIACCFAGCRSADDEIVSYSPSEPESSLTSSESSTPPQSSEAPSENSATTSTSSAPQTSIADEIAEIVPNESLPAGEAPQTDGPPDISVSSPSQENESGKISLSLDDVQEITVSDDTVKATILGYVDSMQESSYNAENTPPAMGGRNVTVTVHRNNGTEQYIFTEVTADGHSLGKDLQGDTFMWMITDSNALPYLLSLFN